VDQLDLVPAYLGGLDSEANDNSLNTVWFDHASQDPSAAHPRMDDLIVLLELGSRKLVRLNSQLRPRLPKRPIIGRLLLAIHEKFVGCPTFSRHQNCPAGAMRSNKFHETATFDVGRLDNVGRRAHRNL